LKFAKLWKFQGNQDHCLLKYSVDRDAIFFVQDVYVYQLRGNAFPYVRSKSMKNHRGKVRRAEKDVDWQSRVTGYISAFS